MTIQTILIILVILSGALFIFFSWVRKSTIDKKKKQLENLREEFINKKSQEVTEFTEENKKSLDEIVKKIKKTNEKGKKTVRIELKENKKLKIITPDVISLKTPQGELYKSFPEIRFEKIENTTDGFKLYLS